MWLYLQVVSLVFVPKDGNPGSLGHFRLSFQLQTLTAVPLCLPLQTIYSQTPCRIACWFNLPHLHLYLLPYQFNLLFLCNCLAVRWKPLYRYCDRLPGHRCGDLSQPRWQPRPPHGQTRLQMVQRYVQKHAYVHGPCSATMHSWGEGNNRTHQLYRQYPVRRKWALNNKLRAGKPNMIRPTLNRFITSGAPERQSDVLRLVGLHGFGVLTSLFDRTARLCCPRRKTQGWEGQFWNSAGWINDK